MKTVTFSVPAEKVAFYDVTRHAFVVEPGEYEIQLGASSADIRERAYVQVTTENVGEKMPPVLANSSEP
jgi:beta-glucosidase